MSKCLKTFALVALLATTAAFASEQSLRVEERNMFYVAPLFLIALMLWVERRCPRPWLVAVPSAVAAVALAASLPYRKLIGLPAVSDTSALLPLWALAPSIGGIGNVHWVVLGVGIGAVIPDEHAVRQLHEFSERQIRETRVSLPHLADRPEHLGLAAPPGKLEL